MLTNALGQIIENKTHNSNNVTLNVHELQEGIYFLTVTINEKNKTYKIIKD